MLEHLIANEYTYKTNECNHSFSSSKFKKKRTNPTFCMRVTRTTKVFDWKISITRCAASIIIRSFFSGTFRFHQLELIGKYLSQFVIKGIFFPSVPGWKLFAKYSLCVSFLWYFEIDAYQCKFDEFTQLNVSFYIQAFYMGELNIQTM